MAKGALGVVQLATAAAIYLGVLQQLPRIAQWLVEQELPEDPNDFLATQFLSWATFLQLRTRPSIHSISQRTGFCT
jgi:hypothetical protein